MLCKVDNIVNECNINTTGFIGFTATEETSTAAVVH